MLKLAIRAITGESSSDSRWRQEPLILLNQAMDLKSTGHIERGYQVRYENLTKPINIGNVKLRNRFVMLPMTIEKVDN